MICFCFLEGYRTQIQCELDTHALKLLKGNIREYSLPIDNISHKERGKQKSIRLCIGKEVLNSKYGEKSKQNL